MVGEEEAVVCAGWGDDFPWVLLLSVWICGNLLLASKQPVWRELQ